MQWFSDRFYAFHDLWVNNFFVGKDQSIYNAIVLLNPSKFWTIYPVSEVAPQVSWWGEDHDAVLCNSGWYYFIPWFAPNGFGTRQGDPRCPDVAAINLEEALRRRPFKERSV